MVAMAVEQPELVTTVTGGHFSNNNSKNNSDANNDNSDDNDE